MFVEISYSGREKAVFDSRMGAQKFDATPWEPAAARSKVICFANHQEANMDETSLSPEELIAGMNPDEICELLAEMDIETSREQAVALQQMIAQFGSLDAAMDAFSRTGFMNRSAA